MTSFSCYDIILAWSDISLLDFVSLRCILRQLLRERWTDWQHDLRGSHVGRIWLHPSAGHPLQVSPFDLFPVTCWSHVCSQMTHFISGLCSTQYGSNRGNTMAIQNGQPTLNYSPMAWSEYYIYWVCCSILPLFSCISQDFLMLLLSERTWTPGIVTHKCYPERFHFKFGHKMNQASQLIVLLVYVLWSFSGICLRWLNSQPLLTAATGEFFVLRNEDMAPVYSSINSFICQFLPCVCA